MATLKNLHVVEKPSKIEEYIPWIEQKYGFSINRYRPYYESATKLLKDNFEKSDFWKGASNALKSINDSYIGFSGFPLFSSTLCPNVLIKSLDSLLIKSFRKNILNNPNYPDVPERGWVGPDNWFTNVKDILRTTFEVKYIDGVEFLLKELDGIAQKTGCEFNYSFEARDVGYYAAHSGIILPLEHVDRDWTSKTIDVNVEIQVTTEIQGIVKNLLHKYYEVNRQKPQKDDYLWQWDYKSDEFATNYLGHIVHYIEGMIVEIRDKQNNK